MAKIATAPVAYSTPPQLAKRWGVDAGKILALIASGQLRAFNVAMSPKGRPRWRISEAAIEAFENNRAAVQQSPTVHHRKRDRTKTPNYLTV